MKRLLALLIFLPLLGCASLTEEECRTGDWRAIGFADGVEGRGPDFLRNHASACAGTEIAPDEVDWDAGRREGLKVYCTPLRAYIDGRDGKITKSICPASLQSRLNSENSRGLSARFALMDFDRDREIIFVPSARLFTAPPPILDLGDGRTEYDILRRDVLRLRTSNLFLP